MGIRLSCGTQQVRTRRKENPEPHATGNGDKVTQETNRETQEAAKMRETEIKQTQDFKANRK